MLLKKYVIYILLFEQNGVQVKKNDAEGSSKNKKSKTYSSKSLLYDQFVKVGMSSLYRYDTLPS